MSREKFNQKERLKLIRLKIGGISQANLSKQLGIPVHKIKDIESGKIKLSVDLALLLEECFNFNFRWLLTGEGKMLCEKGTNEAYPENSLDKDAESDLITKTVEILKSESIYKAALISHINAFHSSIRSQETMNKRMATVEKQITKLIKNRHISEPS